MSAAGFTLAWAPPAQTAAVLTLLPELLTAPALPEAFAVAHVPEAPSRLLGAAAFVPLMKHGPSPGFRAIARVLPAWQRHGIGRALVAQLGAEVRRWDVPHLLAWQAEAEDGAAGRFLRACGFRVNFTMHHFLIDKRTMLPRCARLVSRLRARGLPPPGFALLPLHETPRAAVIELHAREFNAGFDATDAMLTRELSVTLVRELSFAVWNGATLAGYLLGGPASSAAADQQPGGGLPTVRFWAVDPARRGSAAPAAAGDAALQLVSGDDPSGQRASGSGWAAALLLDAFVRRGAELGWDCARYECNANARAPLNVARKAGALELPPTQGWVFDLAPPVPP